MESTKAEAAEASRAAAERAAAEARSGAAAATAAVSKATAALAAAQEKVTGLKIHLELSVSSSPYGCVNASSSLIMRVTKSYM